MTEGKFSFCAIGLKNRRMKPQRESCVCVYIWYMIWETTWRRIRVLLAVEEKKVALSLRRTIDFGNLVR